jgi:YbbR domain-containing protein
MLRRLTKHLGLKFLSVAIAFVLWVAVAGQKQAERSLRVPVEFQNIPETLEMTGDTPDFADVRVRGAASTLSQLRGGDLVVLVDLSTAREGRRMFHLIPDQVAAPTGVRVQNVVPTTVSLTFEVSVSKSVPVVAAVEGTPAPGYVVGKVVASPAMVEVVGPESEVKRLTRATTEPVKLTGATARVRDVVTIGLLENAARLRVPRSAVVTVDVLPAPIERVVGQVPVVLRGAPRGARVSGSPRQVTVTARGPGNLVRNLSPQAIPAWVDVSGLQRGQYNLPVQFDPTGEYSITAVQPPHVRVTIQSP